MPPSGVINRDFSTVVSILPIGLKERKPGLFPGEFVVEPAKEGDFTLLLISRCQHRVYLDETRPVLIVPDPSDMVANSICLDWKAGCPGFTPSEGIEPGLDWVNGNYVTDGVSEVKLDKLKSAFKAEYGSLLAEMKEKQDKWFTWLIREADDNWGKYRAHKFITPLQKLAALRLGVHSRDWQIEQEVQDNLALIKCKFCFSSINPAAIVCPTCMGVLDQDRYAKEFVKVTPMTVSIPSNLSPATK